MPYKKCCVGGALTVAEMRRIDPTWKRKKWRKLSRAEKRKLAEARKAAAAKRRGGKVKSKAKRALPVGFDHTAEEEP